MSLVRDGRSRRNSRAASWLLVICLSLLGMAVAPAIALAQETVAGQADQGQPAEESTTSSNKNDHLLHRMEGVAILVGVAILMLAILFAYLRMDHATRGFYSGRLQSMAFAAVALVLVMAYLLWTQLMNQ